METKMSVAEALEARMWLLADPKTKWTSRHPYSPGEACLLISIPRITATPEYHNIWRGCQDWLLDAAEGWLKSWLWDMEDLTVSDFNDTRKSRKQVIWMLEEAVDAARSEGV